jgi:hypothetical protein
MLLSKQEFSKLSKAQRSALLSTKSKRSKKQQNKPAQKRAKGFGKQASVAAAYATKSQGKPPVIQASRDSCRVVHREFIGNITGTTAFGLSQSLACNPGIASTFPWLSVMAQAWEEYKFHKLRFCYLTRTGSNTPGSVIMSPDYDASDSPPGTEQIMSTYDETVEDAPWKDICCVLKPQLMNGSAKRHFVRSAPTSQNQDVKLYDVANFFVGTVDGTAVSWGKLWVEYDVEFYIPQLPPTGLTQVSIAQGTAGTAANVISAGLSVTGNLISGIVGNVVSVQNLIPGQEYFFNLAGTAWTGGIVLSAPVGLTLKTSLQGSSVVQSATYLATAATGSFTATASANITNPYMIFANVPVGNL